MEECSLYKNPASKLYKTAEKCSVNLFVNKMKLGRDVVYKKNPDGNVKGIYFVIYGIISEFTDKGQFQYLTNLKGPQEGTYLYTTQFLSLR